jgi:hypothetical protein
MMPSNLALLRVIAAVLVLACFVDRPLQAAPEEEALLVVKGAQHFCCTA